MLHHFNPELASNQQQKRMKREMAKMGHAVHHDPQQFAIKYLKIDNAQTATEGIMEATKLVKVSHPNIVSLREQFFKNRNMEEEEEEEEGKPQGFIASILGSAPKLHAPAYDLCLVMERCDGDLQELIRSWAGSGEQKWGRTLVRRRR